MERLRSPRQTRSIHRYSRRRDEGGACLTQGFAAAVADSDRVRDDRDTPSSRVGANYAPGPRGAAATRSSRGGGGGGASLPAAISANRASAGRDLEPVRFMILMRWFSTVRWLMPRSAAMFLLGCPASTSA